MGYFSKQSERLYLPSNPAEEPEKFWVEIKSKLSAADTSYRTTQTMKAHLDTTDGEDSQMRTEVELGAMRQATLERAVLRWNLTDEADAPVELTPAALAELNDEDAEFIAAEVARRNPRRTAAAKNASSAS